MESFSYPIGRFEYGKTYTIAETKSHIQTISALPSKLFNIVNPLSQAQLETPYRPEGWTVLQTVHHIADSHMNAYIRFKLALTEDNPFIKPYEEALWADLADGAGAPLDWSLQLLKYLHLRWVMLLNSLTEEDLQRTYFHPETKRVFPLQEVVAMYAWHSEHHYEHIHRLCLREGWIAE
ncbi:YfiT family bacillithiol transferase [Runella slithyformis]|uniref:Metal-dependent hydrolase n=1 Tax=Runella slithyformis (strain ATCC 29530 / DSM 19594 / LMG 11500 / NCIMB 11436 / LSU 4) TaxID=761193 RepID=A0A7U3ZLI8_RUNSL|nr:putative metal-dependent hydrolase [Runella slithyformis]AEI49401.1 metal-dependent hydrolase [Runella slithyformis DSM 19594]